MTEGFKDQPTSVDTMHHTVTGATLANVGSGDASERFSQSNLPRQFLTYAKEEMEPKGEQHQYYETELCHVTISSACCTPIPPSLPQERQYHIRIDAHFYHEYQHTSNDVIAPRVYWRNILGVYLLNSHGWTFLAHIRNRSHFCFIGVSVLESTCGVKLVVIR